VYGVLRDGQKDGGEETGQESGQEEKIATKNVGINYLSADRQANLQILFIVVLLMYPKLIKF